MKLNLTTPLDQQRVYIFFFLLLIAIFPVFEFMNTQNVAYLAYLIIYSTAIYFITIFKALNSSRNLYLDAMSFFFLYMTINALVLREINNFGEDYMILFLPLGFLSFFVINLNVANYKTFILMMKGLALIALVESTLGISQVFFGVPYFENIVGEELHSFDRNYFAYFLPGLSKNTILASGTFFHFNTLAGFLVITINITYTLSITEKRKIWKYIFYINLLGIIVTFSRGTLLGSMIALNFMIFRNTQNFLKYVKYLLLIPIGIIGLILIEDTLTKYVEDTENASPRFNTWLYCIEHAKQRPLNLIFGYGNMYLKDIYLMEQAALKKVLTNVHNSHLQMLIELGIVGSLIFYYSIVQLIRNMFRENDPWSNCTIALILGFFVTQIFDNVLFSYDGFIFFSLLGLLKSKAYKNNVTHPHSST